MKSAAFALVCAACSLAGPSAAQAVGEAVQTQDKGQGAAAPQGPRYAGISLTCKPSADGQTYSCRRQRPSEPLTAVAHLRRWAFRGGRDPIAVLTIGLFFIGGWQLIISRQTAQRQLRAYLSVTPKTVGRFVAGQRVQITCRTLNHGQTPAYKIRHIFTIAVLPAETELPLEFPEPHRRVDDETTLFPGDMNTFFSQEEPLTAEDVQAIYAGTSALHLWGRTSYRDAFGRSHFTEFAAHAGGVQFAKTVEAALKGETGPGYIWNYRSGHGHSN